MAKAKAKKKKRIAEITELVDPKEQRRRERKIAGYLMELDERAEAREEYVQTILAANDESIEEIVANMVDSLRHMQGPPKLYFEGQLVNEVPGEPEMLLSIQTRNFRYIAVRSLVACAVWDIRIGNFALPKDKCAKCGVPVKKARKKTSVKTAKPKAKGKRYG